MRSKIAAVLALTAAFAVAGSKEREWQTGTVLDPNFNHFFENASQGTVTRAVEGFTYRDGQTASAATASVTESWVVESADTVYLVERTRLKQSKAPALVRYHEVKFATEKDKLWLVDEDGKECQTKIVKQMVKKTEGATQTSSRKQPQ